MKRQYPPRERRSIVIVYGGRRTPNVPLIFWHCNWCKSESLKGVVRSDLEGVYWLVRLVGRPEGSGIGSCAALLWGTYLTYFSKVIKYKLWFWELSAFNFLRVFSILGWGLKLTLFKMTTTTAETMTETEGWREDRSESCKGERTRYFKIGGRKHLLWVLHICRHSISGNMPRIPGYGKGLFGPLVKS